MSESKTNFDALLIKIVETNNDYERIFENANIGIYRSSEDGQQVRANPVLVALNGYASESEQLLGVKEIATEWYVDPNRRDDFKRLLNQEGTVKHFESEIYRHKSRERIWISENAWPIYDEDGQILYYEGTVEDITERKQNERFQESLLQFVEDSLERGLDESFYQRLLERAVRVVPNAQGGTILLKRENDDTTTYHFCASVGFELEGLQQAFFYTDELLNYINHGESQRLSYKKVPLKDKERQDLIDRYGRLDELKSTLMSPIMQEDEITALLYLHNFKEEDVFTEAACHMIDTFSKQVASILKHLTLEQELELSNHRLFQLANYDGLTGLANRTLFSKRLDQSSLEAAQAGRSLALLYLDLDGFKNVNDSLGHSFGDKLLKAVAERLSASLDIQNSVARLGGDEFAIILNNRQKSTEVAKKVLEQLSKSFHIEDRELHISASIGIVQHPEDGANSEDLLKNADAAMYVAKAKGKNQYHCFNSDLNTRLVEDLYIEQAMRQSLIAGEFKLVYQPRIDLLSGSINSFEALARWHHPELGIIAPTRFIPIAEKTGFISQLGYELLHQACKQGKDLQNQGIFTRIAVNLSVKQLQHDNLAASITKLLQETQLDAKWLELEITESAAMTDVEQTIVTLGELRDLGIYLSIDDFGTAYSSLNYLKRLPVNSLKIDKSFVQDITGEEEFSADTAIIEAIMALSKSMNFSIIAEGVETQGQLKFLQARNCAEGQGYLFSRPINANKIPDLLCCSPSLFQPAQPINS